MVPQAHPNLHDKITVHPSSSFTLQLRESPGALPDFLEWNHRDAPMVGSPPIDLLSHGGFPIYWSAVPCATSHHHCVPSGTWLSGHHRYLWLLFSVPVLLWHFLAGLKTLQELTEWAGSHCSLAAKAQGENNLPKVMQDVGKSQPMLLIAVHCAAALVLEG